MRSHLSLTPIICLALGFSCIAQSTETRQPERRPFEINGAPIKDLARELSQICQSGQAGSVSDKFRVMASFKIDPDGSIAKESIRLVGSSGSMVIDEKTIQMLWMIGESHAFGVLSSMSPNTLELQADDGEVKVSITSFAPTPEQAKTKVTQLKFLLKLVAAQQKTKNPVVSELLSLVALKADDNRFVLEIPVSRARAAEILQNLVK